VQRHGIAPRIAAEQPGGTAVGALQAQQDPDGGVLPAPLGPRKPCTSPARTVRSRPSSARVEPKRSQASHRDDVIHAADGTHDDHQPPPASTALPRLEARSIGDAAASAKARDLS